MQLGHMLENTLLYKHKEFDAFFHKMNNLSAYKPHYKGYLHQARSVCPLPGILKWMLLIYGVTNETKAQ